MWKKIRIIGLTALLALILVIPAMADHLTGGSDWSVDFTEDKVMDSNLYAFQQSVYCVFFQSGKKIFLGFYLFIFGRL